MTDTTTSSFMASIMSVLPIHTEEVEEIDLSLLDSVVRSLNDLLTEQLDIAREAVHGLHEELVSIDFVGRCQRLRAYLERLRKEYPDKVELFTTDLAKMQRYFSREFPRFLSTLGEAKLAPKHRWQKWWQGGKYSRALTRLSNELNHQIVDHILHAHSQLPIDDDEGDFPPTIENLQLSRPTVLEENTLLPQNVRVSWHLSKSQRLAPSSTRSTGTASTVSTTTATSNVAWDTSLRTSQRSSVAAWDTSLRSESGGAAATDDSGCRHSLTPMASTAALWDFSPREIQRDWWAGTSSGTGRTRKDRKEQYIKTQILRELPQDIVVTELRVVLAQLEAGDTSPTIVAGKATMRTIGMLGALMVSPLAAVVGGLSAKEAVMETPLEAAAVFCHYLIEFELSNGMVGTLENCVEDIYLYAGKSQRKQQHCVCRIPMTVGMEHAPDSLLQPLLLRDLIQFRNTQRQLPYRLWDNNCKHFVFEALTGGKLFPKATNYCDEAHLEVFFALCQGCYVKHSSFVLFSDDHTCNSELFDESYSSEMDESRASLYYEYPFEFGSVRDLMVGEESERPIVEAKKHSEVESSSGDPSSPILSDATAAVVRV